MVGEYGISREDVIRASGVRVNKDVSGAQLDEWILDGEARLNRTVNTRSKYTIAIERRQGDNSKIFLTKRRPVMQIIQLEQENITTGTQPTETVVISPKFVKMEREGGRLILTPDSEETFFRRLPDIGIMVKYAHGKMEESNNPRVETDIITSAAVEGSSAVLTVTSSTSFAANDIVQIDGIDGNIETAEVLSVAAGTITIKELQYPHRTGSRVIQMQVPRNHQRLAIVYAALGAVEFMLSSTFIIQTGYSLGDLSVQKGVPWTHFSQARTRLEAERDLLKKELMVPTILGDTI